MNILQKEILEEALERAVGNTPVAARHLMGLVREMKSALKEHDSLSARTDKALNDVKSLSAKIDRVLDSTALTLNQYGEAVEHLKGIKQGDAGKDADEDSIVQKVLRALPRPKDGKDGSSPAFDAIVSAVIRRMPAPKDGKDAKAPSTKELLKALKEELTWRDIPGLENEIASYRNQLAGKSYGKDTWARGGGTTVSAGANITLTPLPNGTVQINASGGGSGTNVTTQYQVTAVQAGSDVTIALSQLTNFATYIGLVQLQRNNIPQTETLNFTQTATQLTVFGADAGEIFNIVYQYA